MNIPAMRKATGIREKFEWTSKMEEEYQVVLKIMKTQIRLSPYNPKQKLKIVIDGARPAGTEFLLIKNISNENPEKGIKNMNALSCSLPDDRD